MSTDRQDHTSSDAGTNLRRPPKIWLLVLALIVIGVGALATVLLVVGDETDMEEQPEPQSMVVLMSPAR